MEAAILDDHLGDERFDHLLEGLALYGPESGLPYYEAKELRDLIERTIGEDSDADGSQ